MRTVTIDVETTGMRDDDEIVEIAAVWGRGEFAHSLVRPMSRPISFGAMATHHITPEMVAGAPQIGDALSVCDLVLLEAEDAVLVFHNADYDRKYLPPFMRDRPYICTYRCALHLCPDAESHSNGALWYELGLAREMPVEAGSMPHRALFDALMTNDILGWMIDTVWDTTVEMGGDPRWELCVQRLVDMTQEPVLLKKVRFGKHQGALWRDVPYDYLQWVVRQDFDRDVIHTARYWMNNEPSSVETGRYLSEEGDR